MNQPSICVRVGIDGLNEQGWIAGTSHLGVTSIDLDSRVMHAMDEVLRNKEIHAYEHLYLVSTSGLETSFAHVVMSQKFAAVSRHTSYPHLSSFVTWNHYRGVVGQGDVQKISAVSNDLDGLLMQLLKSNELNAQLRNELQAKLQSCLQQAQKILGQVATGYVNNEPQDELVVYVANSQELSLVLNRLLVSDIYKDYRAIYVSSNKELCHYLSQRGMEVEPANSFFKRLQFVRKYHETIATLRQFQEGIIDERDYYQRFQPQFENSLLSKLEVRMQQELQVKEVQVQELNRQNIQLQQEVANLQNQLRLLKPHAAPQVTYGEQQAEARQRFQPQRLQDKQYQAANRAVGLQQDTRTTPTAEVKNLALMRQQREAALAAQRQRQQEAAAKTATKSNSNTSKQSASAPQQTSRAKGASK